MTLLAVMSAPSFAQKTPAGKGAGGLSIAAVDFPQVQPFKVRIESNRKACDDYGVTYTLLQPQQVTLEGYLQTLTSAINQDFDAILCDPWDYQAFQPVLELARKKGVPLVAQHQKYPDPSCFISMLYIDNVRCGAAIADALGKAVRGRANVVFMLLQADDPNQAAIRDSFIDRALARFPDIKVVDTLFTNASTVTAASVLEGALKASPRIDTGIWLEGATVGVGVEVARRMGMLSKFRVVGVDDPPDLIASIGRGETWGTFVQNFWKQGYEAVRNVVDYYTRQPFPRETDCGVVLVDRSNWNNYLPAMWAPVAVKGKAYSK
jgi:ribose transport system substrate-binding protein